MAGCPGAARGSAAGSRPLRRAPGYALKRMRQGRAEPQSW